jgi:nucleoside transporter
MNSMKMRLGVMMFLEFFIWGAWYVTLGTWLSKGVHFSDQQIGWAYGTTAIGAIVSPFFVGLVADRLFAAQRLLGVLHALGAGLLLLASTQTGFVSLYAVVLLYALCYMPTLALTASLAMRQIRDTKKEFGLIRVFGTIGWIVAGLVVGSLGVEATAMPMHLAAGASLLMAIYSFTLPDTPPLARGTQLSWSHVIPVESVRLLRRRSMAVFALASLLICIPLQFYYAFTNLYLNEIGVHNAAGKMTGGQMSEVLCMLLIPWFFRHLGVKWMLAVGMLAWVIRYVAFAYGNADALVWMLWLGIVLHGICFDFFFVVGQIYIDREAPPTLRAATQGLITFLTYGAGMFIGAWLSGRVVEAYTLVGADGAVAHDWRAIWLFAGLCAAVVLVFFLLAFTDKEQAADTSGARAPQTAGG